MTTEPATQNTDENKDPSACAAYGCPLNGSISTNTVGGGPWFCYLHFGTQPQNRDEITAKIRANVWLYRLSERVARIDPMLWPAAKPMATRYCEQKLRADLAPGADESRSAYVVRLRQALAALSAPAVQERIPVDEPKKPASVGTLADFLPEAA